ncbi:MAG: heavy metal translocating P-type ATPase [Proteobacteria bacterium]|nr:heavy metal translocating P-type ATPase [Pseudomonadota bacterium]
MTQSLAATVEPRAVPAAVPACFHCGLPVPQAGAFRVTVLGRPREMCCAGCEAVARTIVDAGFESYYETRDSAQEGGLRPADLPPPEIYDDPLAQAQFVAPVGEHGREALLMLEGIRCSACVWLNERYLRQLPGVSAISINYATRRAQVTWDSRVIKLGQIISAVRSLGYDAYPFEPTRQLARDEKERRSSLWRLFVAGFGAMQVMMYAFPRYIDDAGTLSAEAEQVMRWASLVLTLPVILFACGPFFSSARADLRARRLGIDVPVSLGILAGFAASAWATLSGGGEVYFDSITMLVFLLLASRSMELSARRAATARLDHLARWMPSFATRLRSGDGEAERIAAHELRPGDRVLVAPGETVPADGLVVAGSSSADESLLTGESRAVEKGAGAQLIGGSVNIAQPLEMQVTRAGMETQAAAIGRLIERAAAGKPRLVESADRIAHVLTWVVLAAAGATLLGWALVEPSRAFWASVAVLMVTCPCALGLAAPIALTSATAALARRGIVLTRAQAVESMVGLTDVVLDKTGTLTEGKPGLAHFDALGKMAYEDCLALAQALESGSRHPVAGALLALPRAAQPRQPRHLTHFPGSGIEATIDGMRTRVGTLQFVREMAGELPGLPDARAHQSPVFLGTDEGWLARFLFEDRLRPEASGLVEGLRASGLQVHLLSGDDPGVVREVAGVLGLASCQGGVSPQDKHDYVKRLQAQGRRVCVIGDGLNDAPVLAQADVSIAMGQGAALAQQQADLVLLSGKLHGVLEAGRISRSAMAAIRQNFAWALAYNCVALPAAALGLIGPWEAAIGMAASSFVVVLNSARLAAALRK